MAGPYFHGSYHATHKWPALTRPSPPLRAATPGFQGLCQLGQNGDADIKNANLAVITDPGGPSEVEPASMPPGRLWDWGNGYDISATADSATSEKVAEKWPSIQSRVSGVRSALGLMPRRRQFSTRASQSPGIRRLNEFDFLGGDGEGFVLNAGKCRD